MKITKKSTNKKSVNASIAYPDDTVVIVEEPVAEVCEEPCDTCGCKYQNALDLISGAIECLAEIAKDDQIAKDSIANLGVVMLDLKGECQ